jgi:hypothetical protein
MDKTMWNDEWGSVGVYGTASNTSANPAPAYGGWFDMLKANGLVLNTIIIEGNTKVTNLTKTASLVVSLSANLQNAYLPNNGYQGTVLWLKQWGSGVMRLYPPAGQTLYDDSTENSYIELTSGYTAMCVFVDEITINGVINNKIWLLSKFRW